MGQAKQRGTKDERVGKAKTSTMGDSPITKVYDVIFGLVDMLYTKTGGINHELIGFDLKIPKPTRYLVRRGFGFTFWVIIDNFCTPFLKYC